jgi:stress response protein SCP2/uncharacterized protein YegL
MQLNRGQRLALSTLSPARALRVEVELQGVQADVACFGLDAQGHLADEHYMIFYNQATSPCAGVALSNPAGNASSVGFDLILDQLPASIERLVFTAALDGAGNMRQLQRGQVVLRANSAEVATFALTGQDFDQERAVMLLELYRKDGAWRMSATGQGFNGGLAALVKHFGGEVAEEVPAVSFPNPAPILTPAPVTPTQTAADAARVSLEKRVEKEAPYLVSLVKKVGISLDKAGLGQHRARVALCLDISGSMHKLYSSGKIDEFTNRILALAARFDDDGELDVFLFGESAHQPAPMQLSNARGYVQRIIQQYPLEGGTDYGKAIALIRRHYFPKSSAAQKRPQKDHLPVYVMFITDGQTSNESLAERQIMEASYEPIFWQFMGIGKSNKSTKKSFWQQLTETDFSFLEKLDTMDNRFIDNANFFSVETPDQESDEGLYDLLLGEYKEWIPKARKLDLLE